MLIELGLVHKRDSRLMRYEAIRAYLAGEGSNQMASKAATAITTRVMAMSRSMRLCWGDCRLMLTRNPPRRPRWLCLSDSITATMCCGKVVVVFCRAPSRSAATCDDRGKWIDVIVGCALPEIQTTIKIRQKRVGRVSAACPRQHRGTPEVCPLTLPSRRQPSDAGEIRCLRNYNDLWGIIGPWEPPMGHADGIPQSY